MRISSCILVASLATTTFAPSILLAQDNDVQAKARQALEQKMKELQQQPAAAKPSTPTETAPATAQPTEPAPTQPAQPAPVTQPPPPVVVVPAQPVQTNAEAIDKAHEALRQKMMELDAEKAAQPAPGAATAAAAATGAAATKATWAAPPAENKSWDAAIAAAVTQANTESSQSRKLDQQEWATQSAPPTATHASASQTHPQQKAMADQRTAQLPPLQGPPSGLSPSQEQRLGALNREYMADRISSEQYQVQRAQIMAQP